MAAYPLIDETFQEGWEAPGMDLFIDLGTAEDQQSGLLHDSVVSCTNLATVHEDRLGRVIGHLAESAIRRLDNCLKTALGLP